MKRRSKIFYNHSAEWQAVTKPGTSNMSDHGETKTPYKSQSAQRDIQQSTQYDPKVPWHDNAVARKPLWCKTATGGYFEPRTMDDTGAKSKTWCEDTVTQHWVEMQSERKGVTESEKYKQPSKQIRKTKSPLGTGSHGCRQGGERKRKNIQIHVEAVFQMVCT